MARNNIVEIKILKKSLALAAFAFGTAMAQPQQPNYKSPSPLDAIPAPLVGALIDLYANYQANRPQLPPTQQSAAYLEQRRLDRYTKVTTGVAVGAAIGALVANSNDRGKAAAIGAVAGGVATLILDQVQAKRLQYERLYGQGNRQGDASQYDLQYAPAPPSPIR